ncbi:DNA polymerase kappa-like, partial [Scleropages formosus]
APGDSMEGEDEGDGLFSWMALNDNKAGMEGINREKINKIILEASKIIKLEKLVFKGSKFYENELKKEQQVNQRIEKMMLQKAQITEQQFRKAEGQVEKLTADLERGRDLGRVVVHVDMDAFYAAVEMRDCPELKDKPLGVGSWRLLSTSNYHARKFGVRAAMPTFIAKKLCPNLIIVPLNFDKYRATSAEVREIFAEYDPNFLPMSLDEAYLDITDHVMHRQSWPESMRTYYLHSGCSADDDQARQRPEEQPDADLSLDLFEDSPSASPSVSGPAGAVVFGTCAEEAVREMRFRIEQKTMLTASAGIAPNMMLAKVCSDKNKPNGQYRIPAERQAVMDFVKNLPIRKVPGIGKVTEKMLSALGIKTCAELHQKGALLSLLFSETSFHHFLQISLGLGSTHINRCSPTIPSPQSVCGFMLDGERKSMSTERIMLLPCLFTAPFRTFAEMSSVEEQFRLCRELCGDLANDLQKEGLKGRTVTVKLKNVNFEVKTRALTLSSVVSTEEEIFAAAKDLLKAEIDHMSPQPLKLRLMGVRVSGFVSGDEKKSLQKSIISFFQSGRLESGETSQHSGAEELPLLQLAGFQKDPGVSSLDVCPVKQEVSKQEAGQSEQQSFFQKAHVRRLRLQAEQQESPGPSDQAPAVEHALLNAPRKEYFTCPVCFQKQEGMDLGKFNQHVDECLTSVYTASWEQDVSSCPAQGDYIRTEEGLHHRQLQVTNVDVTEPKIGNGILHTSMGHSSIFAAHTMPGLMSQTSEGCEEKTSRNSSDLHKVHYCDGGHQRTSSSDSKFGGVYSVEPEGPGPGCPALICPICNVQQDTSDLAIFNRHVDICLNQGVLQEIGQEVVSHTPGIPFSAGVKCQGLSRGAVKRIPSVFIFILLFIIVIVYQLNA